MKKKFSNGKQLHLLRYRLSDKRKVIVIHTGTYNEVNLYEIYTNGTRNYYYENNIL